MERSQQLLVLQLPPPPPPNRDDGYPAAAADDDVGDANCDDSHHVLGDGEEEDSMGFLLWRSSSIRHLITLQSLVRCCGPLSN